MYLRETRKKLDGALIFTSFVFLLFGFVSAARAESLPGTTQLDINATISLACDNSVIMNPLVGTGRSKIDNNNLADCTVITNNSSGYALSWQASTDDLLNSQSDHFAAYSPASSTTPETWDIPNTTSA